MHVSQARIGHYLVDWIVECGANAVRLDILDNPANEAFFDLNISVPADRGASLRRQHCNV